MLRRTIKLIIVTIFILSVSKSVMSQINKEISFKCGQNELSGILTLPSENGTFPAVILLHGSDRGTAEDYKIYADSLI